MATRSRIGVMHGDVVKSVYCHWDGYIDNNGMILLENYDSVKANNLVALGDVSSLRPEIGEAHPFGSMEAGITHQEYDRIYGNMTTFYGRDRGEENVGYKVANSFDEFIDQVESCFAEYYYVMKDGEWYVGCCYETQGIPQARSLQKLKDVVDSLNEMEAA